LKGDGIVAASPDISHVATRSAGLQPASVQCSALGIPGPIENRRYIRVIRVIRGFPQPKRAVGTTDFTDDTDEEAAGTPGLAFSAAAKISED
jgi:hypothetical protein